MRDSGIYGTRDLKDRLLRSRNQTSVNVNEIRENEKRAVRQIDSLSRAVSYLTPGDRNVTRPLDRIPPNLEQTFKSSFGEGWIKVKNNSTQSLPDWAKKIPDYQK